eukprot:CAMPEP_0197567816 /NCGR_PEP_ID=MMETSP1320-20131121/36225_1 /TAXON_ID=91990 /ORGANISM="Bolidomonas sp., Strain RCC2347" /LENGTH=107 /DNA_ID=CAMNT_0043130049 /DNA_START=78 /DNA_END=397 /DNA_ORIENTATION=+
MTSTAAAFPSPLPPPALSSAAPVHPLPLSIVLDPDPDPAASSLGRSPLPQDDGSSSLTPRGPQEGDSAERISPVSVASTPPLPEPLQSGRVKSPEIPEGSPTVVSEA